MGIKFLCLVIFKNFHYIQENFYKLNENKQNKMQTLGNEKKIWKSIKFNKILKNIKKCLQKTLVV